MAEYIKCVLEVRQEDSEEALALLTIHGIVQVMIEDRRDVENLEIPANHWARIDEKLLDSLPQNVRITAYLEDDEASRNALADIKAALTVSLPDAVLSTGREELGDWENSWKDKHGVVLAGARFAIYPPWEEKPEGRLAIEIDPGMAFGTGGHATTVLCLELIEEIAPKHRHIADIGTGSGILAIACAMLGNTVVGIDIDADCIREAQKNAAVNGQPEIEFRQGDLLTTLRDKQDLLIANIIDDAVLALLPQAKDFLLPGGWFVGSGIEADRWLEIEQALREQGYSDVHMVERDGWCAFRAALA